MFGKVDVITTTLGKALGGVPEDASAGAVNWWRCAASERVLIFFLTPWRQ